MKRLIYFFLSIITLLATFVVLSMWLQVNEAMQVGEARDGVLHVSDRSLRCKDQRTGWIFLLKYGEEKEASIRHLLSALDGIVFLDEGKRLKIILNGGQHNNSSNAKDIVGNFAKGLEISKYGAIEYCIEQARDLDAFSHIFPCAKYILYNHSDIKVDEKLSNRLQSFRKDPTMSTFEIHHQDITHSTLDQLVNWLELSKSFRSALNLEIISKKLGKQCKPVDIVEKGTSPEGCVAMWNRFDGFGMNYIGIMSSLAWAAYTDRAYCHTGYRMSLAHGVNTRDCEIAMGIPRSAACEKCEQAYKGHFRITFDESFNIDQMYNPCVRKQLRSAYENGMRRLDVHPIGFIKGYINIAVHVRRGDVNEV